MSRSVLIVIAILAVRPLIGQSSDPDVYVESFRKGTTHVVEESFDVKLTPANSTYRERIKDSAGNDRYEISITPAGPEGDNKITSWRVQMRDLRHKIYNNVLVREPGGSEDPRNNLWWLNPNQFGSVPIRANRIVKVDGFYVMFQVKDMHFTPLDSPYLDSMFVHFQLSNSAPKLAH